VYRLIELGDLIMVSIGATGRGFRVPLHSVEAFVARRMKLASDDDLERKFEGKGGIMERDREVD